MKIEEKIEKETNEKSVKQKKNNENNEKEDSGIHLRRVCFLRAVF